MKIGFIGTGTITEAIVTGLLGSSLPVAEIHLSRRNAMTSAALAKKADHIFVAADNQAVVDAADTVFLAIRPQVAEEVIRALRFREGQNVVSLVAASNRETLELWIGQTVTLTQAVPLPFVATRKGVTAVFPGGTATSGFFEALGSAVEAKTKAEYDVLCAASALMGTYFGLLETGARWFEQNGLTYAQGKAYLAPLFESLSETAVKANERSFAELQSEFSTRGGLNEQAARDFDLAGGTKALQQALDGLLKRVEGR